MDENKGKTIQLSKKSIIIGVAVVLVLVILAYVLTFVLPKGEYLRDENGSIIQGTYHENPELDGIEWWQFLLSPILVLSPTADGAEIVYVILILMLVIGAIFTALDDCGMLVYLVKFISSKFGAKKYLLLFVLPFIFMFLGSSAGMFEEFIPIVPVVVMLSYAMGWDALIGLGMSILAGCIGFSAGIVNPFTVGVAQTIGGIPMFSGVGVRILTFVLSYAVLMLFLFIYAKKIDKNPTKSMVYKLDEIRKSELGLITNDLSLDPKKTKAIYWFAGWMLVIILCALISIVWNPLADYVMYITVAVYVISGIGAAILSGHKGKPLLKSLGKGMLTLLPALIMILVACGVRYIITEGDIMDTILYIAIDAIKDQPSGVAVLLIYLTIFIFEMFIPSGSAKAMLIMPIIFDICSIVGINGQVAVLCLAFGDGFSNMLLPTNAGLLLILGLTTVDYKNWFKWSIKIQLALLALTIGILMLANYVIYPM